jgi:TPR repeat protein
MKVFEWYLKSAKQGHARAQCNLGVKQNYDEAVKFFQLAILGGCEQTKSYLLKLGN